MLALMRLRVESFVKVFGATGTLVLVVIVALASSLLLASQHLQPSDDAYITFRHVKNLVDHGQPTWNLSGPHVLGSTTPAFGLLLALCCKVLWFVQVDQAALGLNVVFHFLIVVLVYLIAKDLTTRAFPALLGALLVGVNGVNLHIFAQGFEAAMLLAVLLGGLYLVRVERYTFAVVLASIAPLIRPEGILLTPLVWGYILSKKQFRLGLLLAYLPIPLLWLAFATAYYESPVPHAIQAKKKFPAIYRPYVNDDVDLVRRLPGVLSHAADLWDYQAGSLVLSGFASDEFETTVQQTRRWIMLLGLPFAIVACIATRDGRIVYLLYPPLFLLLYGGIGHTQPWYFPSFVTFSIILLFTGWVKATDRLGDSIRRYRVGRGILLSRIAEFLGILVFLVFITANRYEVNRGQIDYRHRSSVFPLNPWGSLWNLWETYRHRYYREAAEYLNATAAESATVLISEVGVFGYYYQGEVIDSVGLCSPEALAFYPPPEWDIFDADGQYYTNANNFVPTDMVMSLKPDYIVNSRFYMLNFLRPDSLVLQHYEEVHRLGMVWGEPLVILKRREIAPSGPP